jgi:nucleoside-diphosphate-sugar epimerase
MCVRTGTYGPTKDERRRFFSKASISYYKVTIDYLQNDPIATMRVLITGGGGFLGQKLAKKLVKEGKIGEKPITEIILTDVILAAEPEGASFPFVITTADLSTQKDAVEVVSRKPDVIFHLAGIVSGDAEQNFEKGYAINVDGLKNLLEAIRLMDGYTPRLVFSSTAAVFGSPVPDAIPDTYHRTPRTSYGTQKAICELLLDDYSRKGFVNGVALRFPTIAVRPGKPNKAASSFFSGIIREPLSGQKTVCPVSREIRHPIVSPRRAVEFLLHAATLSADLLKDGRAITMPAITTSVGEMIDALERIAGKETVALITMGKDDFIQNMISSWQFNFDATRAKELGFKPNETYDEIVQAHIEDELGGSIHVAKKQHT